MVQAGVIFFLEVRSAFVVCATSGNTCAIEGFNSTLLIFLLTMGGHKQLVILLLAASYFIYVLYGLLAEGTWDDDCIARFYATSNAFSDPNVWVSLFHRPIWVILFALPVQLGHWVVPVMMSGLCVLTAFALYKASKVKHQKYAWLLIILLLFQPFYFGVGQNALTEPLAALLLTLGYWAMLEKKYHWFVLCGTLLPLARLELAVLLLFWAIILIQHKQWKLIPFLGAGIVVWNIAGMLVSGSADPIWLIHEVLNRGIDPYGEVSFFAFFNRYFYVVGSVTFVLLLIGLLEGIRKWKWNLFIHGQFFCGILLYSVLAAGWDTARSGAFLRHMIVIGPLAAIIAWDGFNHIAAMIKKAKQRKLLTVYLVIILTTYLVFFRNQLREHHYYTETISWVNLLSVILVLLCIIVFIVFSRKKHQERYLTLMGIGMSIIAISFTLITEHPGVSVNPERAALNQVRDIYQQTDLHSKNLLASHPHFLKNIQWPSHQWKTNLVNKENLQNAPAGTVVVWDGHYSTPNKGGIRNTEIPEFGYTELFRVLAADNSYSVIIYEKTLQSSTFNVEERLKNLLTDMPKSSHLFLGLARHQFITGDYKSSKENIDHALAFDSNQFLFHTMLGDLAILEGQLENAIGHFNRSIQLCPNQFGVHTALGIQYFKLKRYESAVDSYSASINLYGNDGGTYFKRGLAYQKLGQQSTACQDWMIGKRLGDEQARKLYGMYCSN